MIKGKECRIPEHEKQHYATVTQLKKLGSIAKSITNLMIRGFLVEKQNLLVNFNNKGNLMMG